MLVQIHGELPLSHEISHRAALLGRERQWIYLLLLLVQWLYPFGQEHCLERVKLVWRRQLAIDDNERTVEVRRAVNFELVGESVPWESIAVAFQEQNMKSDFLTLRMLNFAIGLDGYLLSEYTKERLFVDLYE